ncbi:MAG: hypothetical protein KDC90_10885 [Ignavibacteriae bacterium]|nr:hypothetical protein [Ignavibacteriota bacterium]
MLTSNKKWFASIHPFGTGIVMIFAVLLVSITLFAQNQPNKNNSTNRIYDPSWWNSNVPEKYSLNDDQVSQVNKIKAEYDELIQPEIEKLNSVRGDFSDYQQQDDISSKRIREYQNQIREIEDNIYSLKLEARNKIGKMLNKDQRVFYNDSRIGWWDGFYDRCGWDYADMDYDNRMGNNGYMDYGMRDHDRMDNNGRCCW